MITLTLKFLILLLVLYWGGKLAKRALKAWVAKQLGLGKAPKEPEQPELLACAHCGLHVATSIGQIKNGRFYCSSECAQAGPDDK
ncbi:MAG: hypothetical protein RRB13_05495 [bacterium]|nr:hypothetical protein [bacterium]